MATWMCCCDPPTTRYDAVSLEHDAVLLDINAASLANDAGAIKTIRRSFSNDGRVSP